MARKTLPKLTPETKCSHCKGSICCTYVTQQVTTPRSMREFDHLLWQISHPGVNVYKDEDGWYLLFHSPCRHLLPGGGCGIYDHRPIICREHSNEYCELDAPSEEGFELFFDSYEKFDAYCRKRFKSWDRRFDR